MLINLSNHPSGKWSKEQVEAAWRYGEVYDMPFPVVNPGASHEDVQSLAERYVEEIVSLAEKGNIVVHVMGEMTFSFMVISLLKQRNISCVASTTSRNTEETDDGRKISDFRFVRFREY